jgi:hypothetical protein
LQQSIRTCQCQARGGLASSLYHANTWEKVKKNNLFLNKLLVLLIQFILHKHSTITHQTEKQNGGGGDSKMYLQYLKQH